MDKEKLGTIEVVSFGYKWANPPTANLVFDMRFLKNPHYVDTLKPLTGLDQPVWEFIMAQDAAQAFRETLKRTLALLIPGYLKYGNNHEKVVFAFGCTGGKHRSQCFANECANLLKGLVSELGLDARIVLKHRDQGRE